MSNETEWALVKRDDLLRWAEDFARDNDPGDDTDVVTPFDDYLLQPPAEAQPERYACNGPEGTFWTDDAALANKLIGAAFDRDEWTVTDTQNPTGAAPPPSAPVGVEGLVAMYREAFISERARNYRAEGMGVEQARIHAEADVNAAEAALTAALAGQQGGDNA